MVCTTVGWSECPAIFLVNNRVFQLSPQQRYYAMLHISTANEYCSHNVCERAIELFCMLFFVVLQEGYNYYIFERDLDKCFQAVTECIVHPQAYQYITLTDDAVENTVVTTPIATPPPIQLMLSTDIFLCT